MKLPMYSVRIAELSGLQRERYTVAGLEQTEGELVATRDVSQVFAELPCNENPCHQVDRGPGFVVSRIGFFRLRICTSRSAICVVFATCDDATVVGSLANGGAIPTRVFRVAASL